jgi:hypothetical protein
VGIPKLRGAPVKQLCIANTALLFGAPETPSICGPLHAFVVQTLDAQDQIDRRGPMTERIQESCQVGVEPIAIADRRNAPGVWSAPVAQLDRAPDYESGGQRFESFRARHRTILHDIAADRRRSSDTVR